VDAILGRSISYRNAFPSTDRVKCVREDEKEAGNCSELHHSRALRQVDLGLKRSEGTESRATFPLIYPHHHT